jgi:chemotaxis protein methyltransferase CheR
MKKDQQFSDAIKTMSPSEFDRLSGFISAHFGIKMPPAKKTLLESRLQKRLRILGLASFHDYCDYLFKGPEGADEMVLMINAVTTNKTDFFREPGHFTFLTDTVLPEFSGGRAPNDGQRFSIWSAGCSSGEEPYTLAIVLSEFAALHPCLPFSITATDISTRVLDKARLGIYDEDQIAMIPEEFRQKYFVRSKDRDQGLVRVAPAVRSHVQFLRLNLMDDRYPFREASVNAILCRNVMIYFDRETQQALLGRFCRYLQTGGYLFLGHSETIYGFELPLVRIASTIYRKIR